MIHITVCYATKDEQTTIPLQVEEGTTIEQAITLSKIQQKWPEIDLTSMKTGVYSELKPLTATVREGDRVEIYRHVPEQNRSLAKNRKQK